MSKAATGERLVIDERSQYVDGLLDAARDARSAAYCPYSNFPVGAAVLAADGTVYRGCNVENASYGLTTCAERNAIAAAIAAGHVDFLAIAISTGASEIARPCGACRQVIAEFSQVENPILVISESGHREMVMETISRLLPSTFTLL